MDLFETMRQTNREAARPLAAARMRPRTLDEYVGQEHFLGPGKLLRRMLLADRLNSLIFYGPPGCGKTALAHVIAAHTKSKFIPLNAVSAGTKDVREILLNARNHLEDTGERTILFLDEIHRFNKAQQDVLLPDVEDGAIILIGATTQNPFFSINSPLLSRSQIFTFEPLTREHTKTLILRALADKERGLGNVPVTLTDDALAFLCEVCDGDARRALTALEIGVKSSLAPEKGKKAKKIVYDLELAQDSIQRKMLDFDPTGDTHYDLASAFIKSLRGSDPQAAVYWLARMLESGEDPRFVARRLVIFASEDVGNADPQGLLVANAAWDAVERVGLPECQLNLSQAVCYLATAPKSNAATVAIGMASKDVKEGRTLPVPKHLRDSHYGGAKTFDHGTGYQYAHNGEGGWVDQEYVPADVMYYTPTDRGFEAIIRERMAEIERRRAEQRSRDAKRSAGGRAMTEAEWVATSTPQALLSESWKRKLMSARKKRLFVCGCYRIIWNRIQLPRIKEFVEVAEALADKKIKREALHKYKKITGNPPHGSVDRTLQWFTPDIFKPFLSLGDAAWVTRHAAYRVRYNPDIYCLNEECVEQAHLVRELVGNPFRPVTVAPEWRSSSGVGLAQAMYESRDFSPMPILADALEEAGCDNADILAHCRAEKSVHVRGCWVVDLVLGQA